MTNAIEQAHGEIQSKLFQDVDISLLEMVKIQAQVLVPVLRAFRDELGVEAANRIANRALREWSTQIHREIAKDSDGSAKDRWRTIFDGWAPKAQEAA